MAPIFCVFINLKIGVNLSDIQNITTQINDLSSSISWWNTTIIALMILAAASASGLVIAQFIAFKKAELLSEKQVPRFCA